MTIINKNHSNAMHNKLNINSIVSVDNEEEEEDDNFFNKFLSHNNSNELSSQTNLIAKEEENDSTLKSYGLKLSRSKPFNACLYLVDVFLSIVIFSPIIGLFWYCTWSFFDDYFLNNNKYLSNFLSLGIGLLIILPGYILQENLEKFYEKLKEFKHARVFRFLMRTIYVYFISIAVILQWRSVWNLYSYYLFQDISSQLTLSIISIAYFCFTRATRTLVCNPYLLFTDESEEFFLAGESRHKIKSLNSKYCQYFFDFFMVEIVECLIMNFIWFGLQNYFDNTIYPNDPVNCILITFGISHAICLIILFSQNLVFNQSVRCCLVPRLIIEDLFNIVMVISVILAWKFYWNVIDYFFYTKSTAFYLYLGGHVCSFVLAIICNITSSLVGPGTGYLDGENKETKTYFEVNFLSGIIKNYLGINENEEEQITETEEEEEIKEEENLNLSREEQEALIGQEQSESTNKNSIN